MTAPAIDRSTVLEQLELYREAADNFAAARSEMVAFRAQLIGHKTTLDEIEAEVTVNGGHGEYVVSGSNAEQRKASLTYALTYHERYQEVLGVIRRVEHQLAQAEASAEDDANTMRGARLAIEYATSENYRLAAAEGGPEVRRNGNHG